MAPSGRGWVSGAAVGWIAHVVATPRKERRYADESHTMVAGPRAASSTGVALRPTAPVSISDISGLTSHPPSMGSANRTRAAADGAAGSAGSAGSTGSTGSVARSSALEKRTGRICAFRSGAPCHPPGRATPQRSGAARVTRSRIAALRRWSAAPDLGSARLGPQTCRVRVPVAWPGCNCTLWRRRWVSFPALRSPHSVTSYRKADSGKMARNPGVWRAVARRGARWHVIVTCDRDCCPSRRSGWAGCRGRWGGAGAASGVMVDAQVNGHGVCA